MAVAQARSAGLMRQDDDLFFSVFPPTDFTTPTPEATPTLGTIASPGRSFGGPQATTHVADDLIFFNRAWSSATRYLTLAETLRGKRVATDQEGAQALLFLLRDVAEIARDLVDWFSHEIAVHFRADVLPELCAWQHQVSLSEALPLLRNTISILKTARAHYLDRLNLENAPSTEPSSLDAVVDFKARTRRGLDILVLHSLPTQRLEKTLANLMYQHMKSSLAESSNTERCRKERECVCVVDSDGFPFAELYEVGIGGPLAERAFASAVHRFLKGAAIERRCFEVDWNGGESVVQRLRTWVANRFDPFAEQVLGRLTGNPGFELSWQDRKQFDNMAITNIGRLRTLALFDYVKAWPASIGALLDIKAYINIKEFIGSGGPSEKAFVCHTFMEQVQRRFLHAGASTSEILGIYINVIHCFKTLDARGVLLGKVAAPIRTYLRARDDTVSIVAASFLADIESNGHTQTSETDKICHDITVEVTNSSLEDGRDQKMTDWNDLEWVPDPIDAGPDYRSSKSDDVVANILGLFDQDDFIKEITAVLAQLLLHSADSEYGKETRLVELLKKRLDASKLQAAEVMLKDVRDSVILGKRINPLANQEFKVTTALTPKDIQAAIPEDGISLAALWNIFSHRMKRVEFLATAKLVSHRRDDLLFPKRTRQPTTSAREGIRSDVPMQFKAQVVSSYFWPQLRSNEFRMPRKLEPLQHAFDNRFSELGNQRKLHFRPALSRVSLKLELEDRVIEETDLPGWRASVIDAFSANFGVENMLNDKNKDTDMQIDRPTTTTLTPEQLVTTLEMDEALVTDALSYWSNQKVLYQPTPGVYAVLERLDMETATNTTSDLTTNPSAVNAQDPSDETAHDLSALRTHAALLAEAAPMLQTFIANMLANGGPKAVEGMLGITALLRMVHPGFTFGDEEVNWLLGEMEKRGEVMRVGGGDVWAAGAG